MKWVTLVLVSILVSGCRTSDAMANLSDTSKVVAYSPVIVPTVSYLGTKKALQKSAIITKTPVAFYSKQIGGEQLRRRVNAFEKLKVWEYMGSRGGYHFVALSSIGRTIYRVKESEFDVEQKFPLTIHNSKWRRLKGDKLQPATRTPLELFPESQRVPTADQSDS